MSGLPGELASLLYPAVCRITVVTNGGCDRGLWRKIARICGSCYPVSPERDSIRVGSTGGRAESLGQP